MGWVVVCEKFYGDLKILCEKLLEIGCLMYEVLLKLIEVL